MTALKPLLQQACYGDALRGCGAHNPSLNSEAKDFELCRSPMLSIAVFIIRICFTLLLITANIKK